MNKKMNKNRKWWRYVLALSSLSVFTCQLAIAQNPANPNKVLRYVFQVAETGFDPVGTFDLYSNHVNSNIFETLYTYDYLASPAKLVPRTAVDLPQVSSDGLTYTIHIKKGIFFTDDPVFKGKKRELTAYDYAYSFKRIVDPTLHSANSWVLDGYLVGVDALVQQATKTNQFNYDQPVVGISTPDRYTLVLRLTHANQNFPLLLAHTPTAAVAREVVEKYKNKAGFAMANPVGTGPYRLSKWVPGSRIILTANPNYRGFIWNFKAATAEDQHIVQAMQGKKMPQIGTIDIQVITEAQSRWLTFIKKQADMMVLTEDSTPQALIDGKLKPELVQQGIQLSRIVDPSIDYLYWNMRDPIVGGMSKEKIALRRAMAMAFSAENYSRVLKNSETKLFSLPIPPGVIGYDPHYRGSIPHSVKGANLLLDRYHYKVTANGWRTLPNGQPLVIELTVADNTLKGQQEAEFFKKTLDSLKIKMTSKALPFAEALKLEKQCKTMIKTSAWISDYPDADNFMQLFYGPNIHKSNNACVDIPEYNQLYQQSQRMKPSPERDLLYKKMARLLEVYTAVDVIGARYRNTLTQPRVIGFKKNPNLSTEWMYIDVDMKK